MGGGGQITEGLVGRWRGLGFVPSKLVFEQVSDMTRFHFYRTIVAIVRVLEPGQGWEQMDPLGGCCGKPSERQRGHSEPQRWEEVVGFSLYWKKKKESMEFFDKLDVERASKRRHKNDTFLTCRAALKYRCTNG